MGQRRILCAFIALTLPVLYGAQAQSNAGTCTKPSDGEIAALFDRWSTSLATLHPDRVLKNYSATAMLLPLASHAVRRGDAEIRDYFVYFLQRQPRASVAERTVRADCNLASDTGVYALTMKSRQGPGTETLRVRYSFIYEKRGDDWRIVHEHASVSPEKGTPDRIALVNADPLATDAAGPKAVAGFVKRASARRRPSGEPARVSPRDIPWRASAPEIEAR